MDPAASDVGSALDDVQFLTGSANRVLVLEVLADGPVDRRDLREAVGISQPTTSRTLAEFEERGWVTHDGRTFRTTQLGTHVARTLSTFVSEMKGVRRLRDVVRWFPEEEFGFDLGQLSTAEIVSVSNADVDAPISHLARQLQGATEVRALSHGIASSLIRASAREPAGTGRWVFDSKVLEVLRADPEMATRVRAALDAGRMDYYCYDGDVPFNVVVADETVNLCLTGDHGAPKAEVQSEDEAVLAWADSIIEEYRRDATPLSREMLDG
jgi:predicted transcriptional regulator